MTPSELKAITTVSDNIKDLNKTLKDFLDTYKKSISNTNKNTMYSKAVDSIADIHKSIDTLNKTIETTSDATTKEIKNLKQSIQSNKASAIS